MRVVSAKNANTIVAALSFISFLCLLLLNLGAPTLIKTIYIASVVIVNNGINHQEIMFGLYGTCKQIAQIDLNTTICTGDGLDDDDLGLADNITKLLFSMHIVGTGTSFVLMLLCISHCGRSYMTDRKPTNRNPTLILALFSSLIISLAIGGEIDLFLKIDNFYPISDYDLGSDVNSGSTKRLGTGGFTLGIISLVCSFLSSAFSFCLGNQAATERHRFTNSPVNNEYITDQMAENYFEEF